MGLITFSGGVNNAARVQKWEDQLFHVHYRDQFFGRGPGGLAGRSPNNVVVEKTDFAKEAGYQMTETLMMAFESDGVVNDEIMEDRLLV